MKDALLQDTAEAGTGVFSQTSFGVAITAMALAGACGLFIATRWGIGLYPDSIVYVGAARSIVEGAGFRFINDVGEFAPVTQYPPLYSFAIAVLASAGMDALEGARWISVLFFAANALLTGRITYQCTASWSASLVATFFAITAFPSIYIHSQALTEPPFIFMILLAFSLLGHYLERPRLALLCGASLIIGLSCMARYVGVAFALTGALVVLGLGENKTFRQRLTHTALFSSLALFPLIAWVGRNLWIAGNAVNRTVGFHPPRLGDLLPALDTMGYWLFPSAVVDAAPWISRAGLSLAALSFLALGIKVGLPRSRRLQTIAVCPAGYLIFLLISWSLNDQPLYFDTRTLALPYLAVMMLAVALMTEWFRAARPPAKSWRWFAVDCVLISLGLMQMINGAVWLRQSYLDGIGFAGERWRSSELLSLVKNGGMPNLIFSNAPDFIYTLTGRRAELIPRKVNPNDYLPNRGFAAEMAEMRERLTNDRGVVFYFDEANDRLWYLPSRTELEAALPLEVRRSAHDGTVYGIRSDRPPHHSKGAG